MEKGNKVSCCWEGKNEGSVEWVARLVYLWGYSQHPRSPLDLQIVVMDYWPLDGLGPALDG